MLQHCHGVAKVPLGGQDRVPAAEHACSNAVSVPPRVVVPLRDARAPRAALIACQSHGVKLSCPSLWKKSLSSVLAALA